MLNKQQFKKDKLHLPNERALSLEIMMHCDISLVFRYIAQ